MSIERTAEPSGEVANALPLYRYGQNTSPATKEATVLIVRPILWQMLAMVRHRPLLREALLVPFEYTQSRTKSPYKSVPGLQGL